MRIIESGLEQIFYELVRQAKREIILVTPYLKTKPIERVIKEIRKDVKIRVLTRLSPEDLKSGVSDLKAIERIVQSENSRVKFLKDLHAKIYVFDKRKAIITSANLTEAGLSKNIECGVILEENLDEINLLLESFESWWESGRDLSSQIERMENVEVASLIHRTRKEVSRESIIDNLKQIKQFDESPLEETLWFYEKPFGHLGLGRGEDFGCMGLCEDFHCNLVGVEPGIIIGGEIAELGACPPGFEDEFDAIEIKRYSNDIWLFFGDDREGRRVFSFVLNENRDLVKSILSERYEILYIEGAVVARDKEDLNCLLLHLLECVEQDRQFSLRLTRYYDSPIRFREFEYSGLVDWRVLRGAACPARNFDVFLVDYACWSKSGEYFLVYGINRIGRPRVLIIPEKQAPKGSDSTLSKYVVIKGWTYRISEDLYRYFKSHSDRYQALVNWHLEQQEHIPPSSISW